MSSIGNKDIFAKNLSYYLKRKGKDQKEVAEIVGVAPSTFNEWVKAKKYPRIDKIEILANYFGILKSDLIEEKEKNSPSDKVELTEGEKKCLELYNRVSDEAKEVLIAMMDSFDKVPADKQQFLLELIRVSLGNQK